MPKMKTHRGAAKRFKRKPSGHFERAKSNKQHILTKKTTKRKRALRQSAPVSRVDEKRLRQMLADQ